MKTILLRVIEMYSHNLIFVSNDPKFDKEYFDNYFNDKIYPFKLEQSEINLIRDLKSVFGENTLVVDMYKVLSAPLLNLLLTNPTSIDESEITENEYGALKNLNPKFFPVRYFYEVITNSHVSNDLSTDENFNRFLLEIYHLFKREVYVRYVLNLEPNVSKLIDFYDEKYHKSTFTIFKDFYEYIIRTLFPQYNTPDTFYKLVYLLRDHIIPRLFDCIISMLLDYDSRYLTTQLLQYVLTRYSTIDYDDPIYLVHSIKQKVLIKNWIIMNSFLDIKNINREYLFSRTDNIFNIKAVNVDKYNDLHYPKPDEPFEGFCLQYYNYYFYSKLFDIYLPYNSNGLQDTVDLDKLKLIVNQSTEYMNYSVYRNFISLKYRGIINQDITKDNRLSHYQVVDVLNNISQLDTSRSEYKGFKYLMLDNPTRDDIKSYVENNDVSRIELYLDFSKLNIDIYNQDDVDYINDLKQHSCIISCIVDDDYIKSNEHYNDLLKIIGNVCLKISCDDYYSIYKNKTSQYYPEVIVLKSDGYDDTFYEFLVKTLLNDHIYKIVYFY